MTALLQVNNVTKQFGELVAVNDVSFTVNEREIYGIAGPNGAGKTTLFNTISAIPFPSDAGEIWFDGQPIQRKPAHAIAQAGLARTFQKETVFDSLSVAENVTIGAVYGQSSTSGRGRASRQDVLDALDFVELSDKVDAPALTLPLFEKKRLMLASALVFRPKLLMLDEPAAGLNQAEIQKTIELIRRIQGEGITIILIEHVLPLLLSVSQRIMILNQGEKLVEATPQEVVQDQRVIEAYLGRRGERAAA